jgi:CRISPR/Cas system-associated exonuclease Cas4 (RecB family)
MEIKLETINRTKDIVLEVKTKRLMDIDLLIEELKKEIPYLEPTPNTKTIINSRVVEPQMALGNSQKGYTYLITISLQRIELDNNLSESIREDSPEVSEILDKLVNESES